MSGVLKLIAGGLLALICCYIGILIKRRYKERENIYKSALKYAALLKSELSVKKTPFPAIAEEFCKTEKGEFSKTLFECVKRLSAGNFDLSDLSVAHLKPNESRELIACLKDFGGSSLDEQLALAAKLESFASQMAQTCEKESKRLGNMYFRLFVLLGLAILIILA